MGRRSVHRHLAAGGRGGCLTAASVKVGVLSPQEPSQRHMVTGGLYSIDKGSTRSDLDLPPAV